MIVTCVFIGCVAEKLYRLKFKECVCKWICWASYPMSEPQVWCMLHLHFATFALVVTRKCLPLQTVALKLQILLSTFYVLATKISHIQSIRVVTCRISEDSFKQVLLLHCKGGNGFVMDYRSFFYIYI